MKVYEGAEGWGLVGIFVITFRGHRGAGRTARPHAAQPDPMEPRTPRGYGRKAMRVGVDVMLGPAPVGTIAQR